MKQWQIVLYGILIGLLAAGGILLISRPRQGVPISLLPAPSPTQTSPPRPTATKSPILVQIGGEIVNPDVYSIHPNTRLGDLIELSGGLSEHADKNRINLALTLRDGDYFYIPALEEKIPETARNAPSNLSLSGIAEFDYPINLNEATQEALESLPGIGPTKAVDILEYRDKIGTFTSVEDLLNVPGIGPAILDAIRDYVIVES